MPGIVTGLVSKKGLVPTYENNAAHHWVRSQGALQMLDAAL